MKKITVLLSVLVLALGILAAGCGGGDKKEEKKPAAAPAVKEELIVGTEPSFAPFEFVIFQPLLLGMIYYVGLSDFVQ